MRNMTIGLAICLVAGGFGCTQRHAPPACKTGSCKQQADEPLRHVILCSFEPDTPIERIEAIEDAFTGLPARVSAIQSAEWGTRVRSGPQAESFSHCFVVSLMTQTERDSLLGHPAHQEFMALLTPSAKRVMVFDYWAEKAGATYGSLSRG